MIKLRMVAELNMQVVTLRLSSPLADKLFAHAWQETIWCYQCMDKLNSAKFGSDSESERRDYGEVRINCVKLC